MHHVDATFPLSKCQVRLAGQILEMKAIAIAQPSHHLSHQDFWLCALMPNSSHIVRAAVLIEFVHVE
jgi:hypothetical protein